MAPVFYFYLLFYSANLDREVRWLV